MCTSQIELSADIISFDSKDRIFHYPKYYPRCQEGQKLERGCGANGFKGTTGHKESIPPGPGVSARKEGGACSEEHGGSKCSAQIICPFLGLVVMCTLGVSVHTVNTLLSCVRAASHSRVAHRSSFAFRPRSILLSLLKLLYQIACKDKPVERGGR